MVFKAQGCLGQSEEETVDHHSHIIIIIIISNLVVAHTFTLEH